MFAPGLWISWRHSFVFLILAIPVYATIGHELCQDVLGPNTATAAFDQDLPDWTKALLTIGFAMSAFGRMRLVPDSDFLPAPLSHRQRLEHA